MQVLPATEDSRQVPEQGMLKMTELIIGILDTQEKLLTTLIASQTPAQRSSELQTLP